MVSSRFFDGRPWKYLPAHKRTVDAQRLIFKILSQMSCEAQQHLFLPYAQFLEDTDIDEVFVKTWETKKVHAR